MKCDELPQVMSVESDSVRAEGHQCESETNLEGVE